MFFEKARLLTWLSLVLILGFLATSVAAYVVSRDRIRHGIAAQELPLTGDNIYSELQKDLFRPIFISSLMASDTFLRDWILGGEADTDQITRYLKEVKDRYGAITSFFVSERSRVYYHSDGILKAVLEEEPRDEWYFRVRRMTEDYEINVDPDLANRDALTIFINYRVYDYEGRFLGATGVGLTLDMVQRLIQNYQERFRRRVFFVEPKGQIVLASRLEQGLQGNIRDIPGLGDVAGEILKIAPEPKQLQYTAAGSTILVNSRFIPEFRWFLVVDQGEDLALWPLRQVLIFNLLISTAITIVVLLIAWFTINHYQERLELLATTDKLTGLLNRQALEIIYNQAVKDVERTGQPLSMVFFDIDFFKKINDHFGHLFGDAVLRTVTGLARRAIRGNDVLARWGGEEFLALLRNCSLEDAVGVAEKIRTAIAEGPMQFAGLSERVTVSLGVARYIEGESLDDFFRRADEAMYRAKKAGRDRVVAAA